MYRQHSIDRFMEKKMQIIERDISKEELEHMRLGFIEHQKEYNIPVITQQRYGFVAINNDTFIGCISGLIDNNWFHITDLWLEKSYRRQGIGSILIKKLEEKITSLGIRYIYVWSVSYDGFEFYKKQGYNIICELENYFITGHSRICLRKNL